MPEVLITPAETARRLSVDQATVRRWARQGAIERVRIGGAVRYRESDIDRLAQTGWPA